MKYIGWDWTFDIFMVMDNIGWGKYKNRTLKSVFLYDFEYIEWMIGNDNITFKGEICNLILVLRACKTLEQRQMVFEKCYPIFYEREKRLKEEKEREAEKKRLEEEKRKREEQEEKDRLKAIGKIWIKNHITVYTDEKLYLLTKNKEINWKGCQLEHKRRRFSGYYMKLDEGKIRLLKSDTYIGADKNYRLRYECKGAGETIYGDYLEALWNVIEEYLADKRKHELEEKRRKKEEEEERRRVEIEEKRKKLEEERQRLANRPRKEIEFVDIVVRSNVISCENKHEVEDVVAIFMVTKKDGNRIEVEASAGYCKECDCYFILEESYLSVRKKGVLLCQVMTETVFRRRQTGLAYDMNEYLAEESPLRIAGYTVEKKHNLSADERRLILEYLIDSGLLTKNRILSYLDYFIRGREKLEYMQDAIDKWKSDREYIASYKMGTKKHVKVGRVKEKYIIS